MPRKRTLELLNRPVLAHEFCRRTKKAIYGNRKLTGAITDRGALYGNPKPLGVLYGSPMPIRELNTAIPSQQDAAMAFAILEFAFRRTANSIAVN